MQGERAVKIRTNRIPEPAACTSAKDSRRCDATSSMEMAIVSDPPSGTQQVAVKLQVPPLRAHILEHPTNVGAAFRSAAALGVDAVLVTPRCADPLYRRSVRVSMGTVFQVPWTRIDPWPGGVEELRGMGFTIAALALTDDAVSLEDLEREPPARLALVLGTDRKSVV